LTVAGETLNVAYAGVSYAFLMSLSNATNMFEGVVGAALYNVLSRPPLNHLVQAFGETFLNIAGAPDERTLILQMFVYFSLFFTLLTIPFIELLRRELDRRGVKINLGKRSHAG
jgi:UDP-N-acetylmuramyl pentapeptide phosphotransferase/UDP-N-acetylglucosamine-1-phosphate transferase